MTSTLLARVFTTLLLLAGACFAPSAMAACTVTSSTGVAFGDYDPTSAAPLLSQGSITVDCTGNQTVTMTLTAGNGPYATRYMKSAANPASGFLYYNLYLDSARTIIFGDGTGGSSVADCRSGSASPNGLCGFANPSGSSRLAIQTIYGRINASQDVGVGDFTDTLTYTVTF
jgi:spore coat protein U-like protein